MATTTTESPEQALKRIQSTMSKNDIAVVLQFADCGIHPDEIDPRENVLTFRAWKAKGRRVAKGAISQRITVWIPKSKKKGDDSKESKGSCYPKTTSVFHISQTIAADDPKGTKPGAWDNPALIRPGTYEGESKPAIENVEPWTEETTIEQAEQQMLAVLTGDVDPSGPFQGPTIGDIKPPSIVRQEVLELNESGDLVTVSDDACN